MTSETLLKTTPLDELRQEIASGEDTQHQFKADVHSCASIAAEMVALSNSQGGRIFIGIADNGDICGVAAEEIGRLNQLVSNAASQHVRNPIVVTTENISVEKDRVLIVVTVPEGNDKPYFDHQGVIWLKSGSDKRRVNSKEELRRLFQEVGQLHADELPTRFEVDALDMDSFSDFLRGAFHEALPEEESEIIHLLENLNLVKNGHATLAGLLIFGKKPQFLKPAFVVKAVCFAGNDIGDTYLDSEDFGGAFPKLFRDALAFIMRNLRKVQKDQSVNSIGQPEIPQVVFEELLVNAMIHRDYFITAPIRLFVYENRIEIISPGSLPGHLTVPKICAGASSLRNPTITTLISKGVLPYRGLGTGVRRALHEWHEIEFEDDPEGCQFTTTVFRTQNAPTSTLISAPINCSISPIQKKILALLEEDGYCSYNILAEKLGKNRTTIMRHVRQLRVDGLICRIGSKKTGFWRISGAPSKASLKAPIKSLQQEILVFMRENKYISYDELAENLGKDRTTIMRHIRRLRKNEVIRRIGSKKAGYWQVISRDNAR